jgi:hypothetical protein
VSVTPRVGDHARHNSDASNEPNADGGGVHGFLRDGPNLDLKGCSLMSKTRDRRHEPRKAPNEANDNPPRFRDLVGRAPKQRERTQRSSCAGFAGPRVPTKNSANEPAGKLYRFCGAANRMRKPRERTQTSIYGDCAGSQATTKNGANEPTSKLYRFCGAASPTRKQRERTQTSICAGFAGSRVATKNRANEPNGRRCRFYGVALARRPGRRLGQPIDTREGSAKNRTHSL